VKTIIDSADLISYFLYPYEKVITSNEDGFIVDGGELSNLYILESNYQLVENVTEPSNYKPAKYKLIDNEWVFNPFYIPTE
jgi:hypothetical protein